MKKLNIRMKSALLTLVALGSIGFGAAQAVQSSTSNKCVHPVTGCECRQGCQYGAAPQGPCCFLP